MSTMHDPREEAAQSESTASGVRMIALGLFIIIATFVAFIAIAYYAGFASR